MKLNCIFEKIVLTIIFCYGSFAFCSLPEENNSAGTSSIAVAILKAKKRPVAEVMPTPSSAKLPSLHKKPRSAHKNTNYQESFGSQKSSSPG